MNKRVLIELAKQYFISDAGLSVPNLIRKIQVAEGKSECFATGRNTCDETACRWRNGCLSESDDFRIVDSFFNVND